MLKTIVSASAGTGKTWYILNEIFKYSETEPSKPTRTFDEAIKLLKKTVFLSFSNAAVEEIKERLFRDLPKTDGFQKGMEFQAASSLRAYTLHSFALDMARLFRYELALPPRLEFADESVKLWSRCAGEFLRRGWNVGELEKACGASSEDEKAMLSLMYETADKKKVASLIHAHGINIFFAGQLGFSTYSSGWQTDGKTLDVPAREALNLLLEGGTIKERALKLRVLSRKLIEDREEAYVADQARADALFTCLLACNKFVSAICTHIGKNIYERRMFESGLMEFDAVVMIFLRDLLKENNAQAFFERLKQENLEVERIFIDEAQDNDILQNFFIHALQPESVKVELTVVGDFKQSIYMWRNAYPEQFKKIHKEFVESLHRPQDVVTVLNHSRRLDENKTRKALNEVFTALGANFPFWTYSEDDDLQPNPDKVLGETSGLNGLSCIGKNGRFSKDGADAIKKYLATGSGAVITRSRGIIAKSGLAPYLKEARWRMGDNVKLFKDLPADISLSSIPEYRLLYCACIFLSEDSGLSAPFAALFSRPGRLMWEALTEKPVNPVSFQADLEELRNKYRSLLFSDAFVQLADKNNIWQLFNHNGLSERPETLRDILHLIYRLRAFEASFPEAAGPYRGNVADAFEEFPEPHSWFSIKSRGEAGTVEISTVHSAKGLEYDKIVVLIDSAELFRNPNLGRDEKLKFLYDVNFGPQLVAGEGDPSVTLRYFPYLGNAAAYICQAAPDVAVHPELLSIYNDVDNRRYIESLNLLYVALTRARQGALVFDFSPGKFWKACPVNLPQCIEANWLESEKADKTKQALNYIAAGKGPSVKEVPVLRKLIAARDLIKKSPSVPFKGTPRGPAERWLHVDAGVMLHSALERLAGGSSIEAEIKALPANNEAAELVRKYLKTNGAGLAADLKKASGGKRIMPEVPLWAAKDGKLVRAVMDALVPEDGAGVPVIFEYKSVFGDPAAQTAQANDQLEMYKGLLSSVGGIKNKDGILTKPWIMKLK